MDFTLIRSDTEKSVTCVGKTSFSRQLNKLFRAKVLIVQKDELSQSPGQNCEASETQGLCHNSSCFVLLSSIKPTSGLRERREGEREVSLVWVPGRRT